MISSRLASSSLLRGAGSLSRLSTASRSMATVASRIGEQKVEMSNLEQSKFINYQRIEDNLQVVRQR